MPKYQDLTMARGSVLVRLTDGKKFIAEDPAHWTRIHSKDGEVYDVKWIGADQYVGVRGPGFRLLASGEEA